jgi:hypothetical protein
MNVLANCRKHFPKDKADPNKPGDYIPNPKWEEFLKDWNSLLNSLNEAEYESQLVNFRKHNDEAVQYCENTWLKWKEKLVCYWVNQVLHFGIRVTSPIEGCHAVLKSYLKVSTSDLKGVFDRLVLFWPDQHQNILNSMAQEKNKVKHALHKAYFNIIQSLVYNRALHLILRQCAKLHKAKEENTHLRPCICTIKQSMGLPCFHTIHQRFVRGGYILLEDIHPF